MSTAALCTTMSVLRRCSSIKLASGNSEVSTSCILLPDPNPFHPSRCFQSLRNTIRQRDLAPPVENGHQRNGYTCYLLYFTIHHKLFVLKVISCFSLRFNGHFPGGPGLASTRKYPFWILLELRVMEVVVTTGTKRLAKVQSNVTTNKPTPSFFTGRMLFLSPNQQCQSTEGKKLYVVCTNI